MNIRYNENKPTNYVDQVQWINLGRTFFSKKKKK